MSEIEIRNLSKSFGERKVLDNVSLKVEKGDIYGVLGLSGAGKSTLVRCINGLETFDEGEIYFRDELLCSPTKRVERLKKRKIGMIFQSFNLLQQRTVLGNVELALEIAGVKDKKTKALECIEKVGLSEHINKYPSQLSGGQCQRVAIARALALEPEVLLSDEATSALDPETTNSILDLFKKLNKELGLTIIMISHQMNAIERICNKVAIIDKAVIVEKGDLGDVFLNPQAEVAKQLIYSDHLHTKLNDQRLIRIIFDGNSDEPILANIIQECGILVSVVFADTKSIEGKVYGQMLIKCPIKNRELTKLRKYLTLHNVKYREEDANGVELEEEVA